MRRAYGLDWPASSDSRPAETHLWRFFLQFFDPITVATPLPKPATKPSTATTNALVHAQRRFRFTTDPGARTKQHSMRLPQHHSLPQPQPPFYHVYQTHILAAAAATARPPDRDGRPRPLPNSDAPGGCTGLTYSSKPRLWQPALTCDGPGACASPLFRFSGPSTGAHNLRRAPTLLKCQKPSDHERHRFAFY